MTNSSTSSVTLAPPGAGLPAPERFIARQLFALKRRFGTREAFHDQFLEERAAIRHLVDSGKTPLGKADTATVKPSPEAGAEVEAAYEESCDSFLSIVAKTPDLKTALRYEHPWFGPLDAAGWQALAAMHLGFHRRQIEAIRAGL